MTAPEAKLADGFFASALHVALPLLIWAAHFFLSYASAEVTCALRLQRFSLGGVPAPSMWLWIISATAVAMLVVLTVAAVRDCRADAESGNNTQAIVQIGAATLALVGVLWSAVPIAFTDVAAVCRAIH